MLFTLADQVRFEMAGNYGTCIAASVIIYDYLLTFQQERDFVWNSNWSWGKALFLLNRYTSFLAAMSFLFVGFGRPVSKVSCSVFVYLVEACSFVLTISTGLVMALRTWAIWNRNRLCGIALGVAWAAVTLSFMTFSLYSVVGLMPYGNDALPSFPGCGTSGTLSSGNAASNAFICAVVYEGLIFILTAIRGLRYFYKPSPLIFVLYRDAFLASAILLALGITNATLSNLDSIYFNLPYHITLAFLSIAPCRIILNLRRTTSYVDDGGLLTTTNHTTDAINLSLVDLDLVG